MKINKCAICGKTQEEHCIFVAVEVPDGCVCYVKSWGDNIPPICDSYEPDGEDGYCRNCEHDQLCHINKEARKRGAK